MPKQIKEVKQFVSLVRTRKDLKAVRIKKNKTNTKFKVRTSKYLYTLVVTDAKKAQMLRQIIPAQLVKEI